MMVYLVDRTIKIKNTSFKKIMRNLYNEFLFEWIQFIRN